MSGTVHKELRPLLKRVRAAGWRERPSTDGILVYPPNGERPVAFHGSTKGRGTILRSLERQLRRGGLDV